MMHPQHVALKNLVNRGIIPKNCFRFEIVADVNDCPKLITHSYVTEKQFTAIANALIGDKDQARQIAERFIYSETRSGKDGIGPL